MALSAELCKGCLASAGDSRIANNCSLSEGPLAAKTYKKMECQRDAGGGSTPPTRSSTGPICFRQAALVLIMATARLLLVLGRAGGFPRLFHRSWKLTADFKIRVPLRML